MSTLSSSVQGEQCRMDVLPAKDEAPSAPPEHARRQQVKGVSKEDWNTFKPLIRKLYLDQGKTLLQVAEELKLSHAFKPTKKQLLYRISAWGFEKNVKRAKRGEIVKRLGPELQKFDASVHLNGRRLDKPKLDRWKRQEKLDIHGSSAAPKKKNDISGEIPAPIFSQFPSYPKWMEVTDGNVEEAHREPPAQQPKWQKTFEAFLPLMTDHEMDAIPRDVLWIAGSEDLKPEAVHHLRVNLPPHLLSSQAGNTLVPITHYPKGRRKSFNRTSVDVVGSPLLKGLIGTLAVLESEEIPAFDLGRHTKQHADDSKLTDTSSDKEISTFEGSEIPSQQPQSKHRATGPLNTERVAQIFEVLETWTQPSLHHKDYAFPTLRSRTYNFSILQSPNFSMQVKRSASECSKKLKDLEKLKPIEIITLADEVGSIAQDHYNLNDYVAAELWFRRAVLVRAWISWYEPEQTMWACIRILDCMLRQDQYKQVQKLHQGLDIALDTILGSQHPVSIGSRELKASLLGAIGLAEEEEMVLRQVLQARMETLGLRHPATVVALENLGYSLSRLERNIQAQHLLQSAVRLRIENMKASNDLGQREKEMVKTMSSLTRDLDANIKDDENNLVLEKARRLLGNVAAPVPDLKFGYLYYRARSYQLQGRMREAEAILQDLLNYHENAMPPTLKADVIDMLAEILSITGRQRDSIAYLNKLYALDLEMYGCLHSYTMSSCKKVGFSYVKQGHYNMACQFWGAVERDLKSGSSESMMGEQRLVCAQQIREWIVTICEMRDVVNDEKISHFQQIWELRRVRW